MLQSANNYSDSSRFMAKLANTCDLLCHWFLRCNHKRFYLSGECLAVSDCLFANDRSKRWGQVILNFVFVERSACNVPTDCLPVRSSPTSRIWLGFLVLFYSTSQPQTYFNLTIGVLKFSLCLESEKVGTKTGRTNENGTKRHPVLYKISQTGTRWMGLSRKKPDGRSP